MIEFLQPDFVFEDERGSLVQLVHDGCRQMNIVFSKAGAVRGKHYHRLNDESFYVIDGKISLLLTENGESQSFTVSKGDMFRITKGTVHEFIFETDCLLAGLYDVGVELENGEKDIIPVTPK